MLLRLLRTNYILFIVSCLFPFFISCKTYPIRGNDRKDLAFECNPKFRFEGQMWADDNINKIYDSLNHIDFSKEDFELRIWYYCAGQIGIANNVFIMRHYMKGNKWKAFYYRGFKEDNNTHKTMKEFFSNNELTKYKPPQWQLFWDTLVANNILSLVPPSQESLSKILGGGWVSVSHDCYYTFELVKKDCKRSYGFSSGVTSIGNFNDLPEFKTFHKLIALMNSRL